MLSNLKCAAREFLGLSTEGIKRIICEEMDRPVLACVTILCKTIDSAGSTTTTLGAEAFVSPDGGIEIPIYPHRMTACFTYFVSGHPNLVLTSFKVGNIVADSDTAGKKYGEWKGTVDLGMIIRVRVEYRKPSGRLV